MTRGELGVLVLVGAGAAVGLAIAGLAALWSRSPDPTRQSSAPNRTVAGATTEEGLEISIEDATDWIELVSERGLKVRRPRHAWTTPAVRSVLRQAARVAEQRGGALQIADVAGPDRGAPVPPHKSHRWGRDLDLGYTLDVYPTLVTEPPARAWIESLQEIAQYIEVVGIGDLRARQITGAQREQVSERELEDRLRQGTGLPFAIWPDHVGHAHVRFNETLAPSGDQLSQLLPPGTHLSRPAALGVRHHGILSGRGTVIHADGTSRRVVEQAFQTFAPWGFRVESVHGGPAAAAKARSSLGRLWNLREHNCEHFARACADDDPRSLQLERLSL